MNNTKTIGRNVRYHRLINGMTQEELGKKASEISKKHHGKHGNTITVKYINVVETGNRSPNLTNIEMIAEALDVDLRDLLDVEKQFNIVIYDICQSIRSYAEEYGIDYVTAMNKIRDCYYKEISKY